MITQDKSIPGIHLLLLACHQRRNAIHKNSGPDLANSRHLLATWKSTSFMSIVNLTPLNSLIPEFSSLHAPGHCSQKAYCSELTRQPAISVPYLPWSSCHPAASTWKLGAEPAGAAESRSGWEMQTLGEIGDGDSRLPRGTVSSVHTGEGFAWAPDLDHGPGSGTCCSRCSCSKSGHTVTRKKF